MKAEWNTPTDKQRAKRVALAQYVYDTPPGGKIKSAGRVVEPVVRKAIASYAGRCAICGRDYPIKALIMKHRDGWGHAECELPARGTPKASGYLIAERDLPTPITAAPPKRSSVRLFVAQYEGECIFCPEPIVKHSQILKLASGYAHKSCVIG